MDSTISHTYNILLFFHVFSSETALTWFAMDFTDDPSGQLEKLAVRFKLPETKEEFKKAFETAQAKLKTNPPQTSGAGNYSLIFREIKITTTSYLFS